MDFTREPIIETIITPREGCKLAIRSSKSTGNEEFFVDAVEVVSFGPSQFFRSSERPKPFLVPVSDYEVLEVKEARMVLKHVGPEKSIKIGGGREAPRPPREAEKSEERIAEGETTEHETRQEGEGEARIERKREKRRPQRKRRERDGAPTEEGTSEGVEISGEANTSAEGERPQGMTLAPAQLSALLAPPQTLISETIGRYRDNQNFKGAFFLTEEEEYKPHGKADLLLNEEDEASAVFVPSSVEKGDVAPSEFYSHEEIYTGSESRAAESSSFVESDSQPQEGKGDEHDQH